MRRVVASCLLVYLAVPVAWAQDCAEVVDDSHVRFQGQVYRAVDDEGVYFVDEAEHAAPYPQTRVPLAQRIGERACRQPVRLRLVDYVDCTKTDHSFVDGGGSRLLALNGTTFRVTAAPQGFALRHFSYQVGADPWPGRAHLLVVETIDDRERYTSVALTHPRVGAWAPPFQTEPLCPIPGRNWDDCFSFCHEPDCFHPDVGITAYTGLEYPTDGERFYIRSLFYPKMDRVKVTISSSGWYRTLVSSSGAAASRIWVYRFVDDVADRLPAIVPPETGGERRVGLYTTHPWYFYAHYGVPARTVDQRRQSLGILLDTLAFCGFNWLEFNAINGSDRAGVSWYDSAWFHNAGGNLLEELPSLAEERGIGVVPIITSLTIPDPPRTALGVTFTDNSYQVSSDGLTYTLAFGNRAPDPLRPEVQDWLALFIDEIAARVAHEPAVKGLGFRANGKIGLCYQSNQDGLKGAKQSGYSRWNLDQFKAATGSAVPTEPGQAYGWLRSRPAEWERWLAFRCARTRDFWLRIRDRVRAHRPDWNLYVKIVLPSELPGTNIEWPEEQFGPIEILRHHGYDPDLYANDEGIVIERTMMVDEDRFFYINRWGSPTGANDWAYKAFHYQPDLPRRIRTAAGTACELYHNYWEESNHPDWEFGSDLRTHTATGPGRAFYEPVAFSLRYADVDTFSFMGWERPIQSHEHDLRAFAAAFRALPDTAPRPFDGNVAPDLPEIAVRWYGDRLALLNDSATARTVRLTFPAPRPANEELVDLARGHVYLHREVSPRDTIDVSLEPWSLVAIGAFYDGPPPTPTATPTGPSPTPTGTDTPTATPTRASLLLNPGFEQDGRPGVNPPRFWGTWGDKVPDGTASEGQYGLTTVFRRYQGTFGGGTTANSERITSAGLFQTVPVVPGTRYRCTAMAFTPRLNPTLGPAAEVRLGADPTGGIDPKSSTVRWTPWSTHPDAWGPIGLVDESAVPAAGESLTLFLEYRQLQQFLWNGMFFDAAEVRPEQPLSHLSVR